MSASARGRSNRARGAAKERELFALLSESLGIKVERQLNNSEAASQLAAQLRKRFASSREAVAFDRGAFDE